ncbi:hypothetical protein LAZ67_17002871 [Cordylochernes scorpioides]|uniref:Chitin-binding type-2 domain-containing protein n=1 Tax=Cordylochernes scorpioides TaxID=51811 RepID=A0ABY6LEC8_9ARAC|nr:hypothetical protein LAZ67_17002871 [Cordylochernes scorpioides]
MKLLLPVLCLLVSVVYAQERDPRQAYNPQQRFPGPRNDASAGEEDDAELYQAPRGRQFQGQPVQQFQPAPQAAPAPQRAAQYEAPAPARRRQPQPARAASRYEDASREQRLTSEEEEEEPKPDLLAMLLQQSKFSCQGKQDGYYADDTINCQVFHYCVAGARHSWMCPEGTVFHQVHLNCVPANQDICAQSQNFFFVNDYLYKPADYNGPNNTARYHQRFYPDGYAVGDPIVAPNNARGPAQAPTPAQYAPEQPAYAPETPRPAPRPQQAPSRQYRPAAAQQAPPASRPAYRPQAAPAQPAYRQQATPQTAYRATPTAAPVPQTYRPPTSPSAPARARPNYYQLTEEPQSRGYQQQTQPQPAPPRRARFEASQEYQQPSYNTQPASAGVQYDDEY